LWDTRFFVRPIAVFAALMLLACGGPPDVYAPSTPRKPIDIFGTDALGAWVAMNSKDAPVSIVRGIGSDVIAGAWRWASPTAELRFYLNSTTGWKAKADYSIARAVLDQAGPITLRFFVNNTLLDTVRHERDGRFTWEKPVPASALVAGGMNYLRIEADKFIQDAGGRQTSFILTAAGFVR
jgi:hypothetical protein